MTEFLHDDSKLANLLVIESSNDLKCLQRAIEHLSDVREVLFVFDPIQQTAIYQVKCHTDLDIASANRLQEYRFDDYASDWFDDRTLASDNLMPWCPQARVALFSTTTAVALAITPTHPSQCSTHRKLELPSPGTLTIVWQDLLPDESRSKLLRFIMGILAALRILLARVLAATSRRPDALTFLLLMLAACLRYGHREEPDDHALLSLRRNLTSMGSCPQLS